MTSHHSQEVGLPSRPRSDLYRTMQVNELEEKVQRLEAAVERLTKLIGQNESDLQDLRDWVNWVKESGQLT